GVTRQRMYLETLEGILATSTKVLLDTEGTGNLIYLPLDRLMDRRSDSQSGLLAPSGATASGSTSSAQGQRARDSR
ncbi:MAG: protease modulator HflK, partial [Gammaproteobacteria bacterium]